MNTSILERKDSIVNQVYDRLISCEEFLGRYGIKIERVIPKGVHMTQELRREIWEKFIENTDPLVMELGADLADTFGEQQKEVLVNLRRARKSFGNIVKQDDFIDDVLFDGDEWVEEFADVSAPHILGGVTAGAVATLDRLDTDVQFNPATDLVQDFVKTKSFANSLMLNETTEKQIRKALEAGLAEGEGVQQMAKRIDDIFAFAQESRSTTIAQTEMIGSVNKGGIEGSKQSGVVWGSQWVGSLDNVIRESHEDMTAAEEAVPLGEYFSNGLEYPGDQGGDAGEVINCRCTLLELTSKP